MKEKIIIGLLIFSILILSGCESIDVSKLSDEDLGRIADKAIVCNPPYIRYGSSCCLDKNNNQICDRDERELTAEEKQAEEEIINPTEEVVETPFEEEGVGEIDLPSMCALAPGLSCEDFKVDGTANTVTLVIQNSRGADLKDINIYIGGDCVGSAVEEGTLSDGEKIIFVIPCSKDITGPRFKEDIIIKYISENGLTYTIEGVISVRVEEEISEEIPFEEEELPEKCTLPMGLYCKDHVVNGVADTISLKLENGIGQGIMITSIDIDGQILNGCAINLKTTAPGGVDTYNELDGWHLANGDSGSVTIPCTSIAEFSGKTKGDITLIYCDDTSVDDADCTAFSHTMEGELLARVEEEIPEEEMPIEEEPEIVGGITDIQILRGGFDPEELLVSVGSVVTWKNMDDRAHVVVLVGGERSPILYQGDTFEYKFEEAGTYDVMDAIFGFKGKIIVAEVEEPEEEIPIEEEPEVVGGAADVQILRGGFDPEELIVINNTIVTWKNMDDRIHVVVLIDGERSPTLEEGDTFEYKFEEVGTYDVMDAIFGFKGKIIIE